MTTFSANSNFSGYEAVLAPDGTTLMVDPIGGTFGGVEVIQYTAQGSFIREFQQQSVSISSLPFFDVDIDASAVGGHAIAYHALQSSSTYNLVRVEFFDPVNVRRIFETIELNGDAAGVDVETFDDRSTAVIYAQPDDTNGYDLMLTRYNLFGQELNSAVNLTNSNGIDDTNPSAGSLQNGNIAVAALRDTGTATLVQVFIVDREGNEVAPRHIASPGAHTASDPELVVLNNGNFVVVWSDDANGGVFFQMYRQNGTPLGSRQAVHLGPERAESGGHDVTALANGGFAISYIREVVGTSTSSFDDDVLYRTFAANGTPTSDPILSPDLGNLLRGSFIHEFTDNTLAVGTYGSSARIFGTGGTIVDDYVAPTAAGLFRLFGGNDVFDGTAGNDTVYGGAGSDQINGGAGDDLIFGGASSPGTTFNNGPQILRGGNGNDHIIAHGASQIFGDAGSDLLIGSGEDDLIEGGTGDDIIRARDGSDLIRGGDGNDRITTGGGNNTVFGGAGNDLIRGDNDAVDDGPMGSFVGSEYFAGDGNDTVFGSGGNDQIFGDGGNDHIRGQRGDDTIWGGTGADRFIYDVEAPISTVGGIGGEALMIFTGFGDDVIADFQNGPDRLRISDDLAPNFAALDVSTVGAHVIIDFGTDGSITLLNMAGLFDAGDVIFF